MDILDHSAYVDSIRPRSGIYTCMHDNYESIVLYVGKYNNKIQVFMLGQYSEPREDDSSPKISGKALGVLVGSIIINCG